MIKPIDKDRAQAVFKHSYEGYVNARLTWMDPERFIELAGGFIRSDMTDGFVWDEDKFFEENELPYLYVFFETGQVSGHEGRHRAVAAAQAGIEEFPVVIELMDERMLEAHMNSVVSLGEILDRMSIQLPMPDKLIPQVIDGGW